jgi:hypothetical protein
MAVLSSDSTKIVCIGITDYQAADLKLRYAAANALALAAAFANPDSCGIPEEHIVNFIDAEATKAAILSGLKARADACTPEDILIVYFAGHGKLLESAYYILPVDVNLDDLQRTGIESDELRTAMVACRARGILLILDCCQGAGFVETAGQHFTTIGAQDFRIVFSASRAGQSSLEFESFGGTIFSHHLIEVVRGRVPIGDQPGVVYLSDLLSFLSDRLAEDLESLGQPPHAQDTVFAGSYARDPRLFILRQVALATLDLETPKYSRKFVRRARRRAAWAVLGSLFVLTLAYYYYLDHSYYFSAVTSSVSGYEGQYLAVFRGHPRLNALGFPRFVRALDLPFSALPGTSPVSRSEQALYDVLPAHLPSPWRAVVEGWGANAPALEQHIKAADDAIDLTEDPPGLAAAVDLLGALKEKSAAELLEANALPVAPDRGAAALRHIAAYDSGRALDLYQDGMEGQVSLQRGLLEGLAAPCPEDGPKVLASLATSTYDLNRGRSLGVDPNPLRAPWWAATLRSGCVIDSKTVTDIYDHEVYRDNDRDFTVLAYLILHPTETMLSYIENDLRKRSAVLLLRDPKMYWLDRFEVELKVWSDLRILTAMRPKADVGDLAPLLAFDLDKNVKLAAAQMLLARDSADARVLAAARNDLWIVSTLVDAGWYDDDSVQGVIKTVIQRSYPEVGRDYTDALMYFMRIVRRRQQTRASEAISEIAKTSKEPKVVVDAGRTLDALQPSSFTAPDNSNRTRFFKGINGAHVFPLPPAKGELTLSYAGETSSWYVAHYDAGFDLFKAALGSSVRAVVLAAMDTSLSEEALAEIRAFLTDPKRKYAAAALLAARGEFSDLQLVLESPDVEVRQNGIDYALLNPQLRHFVEGEQDARFGVSSWMATKLQLALKTRIENELSGYPAKVKGLLVKALVSGAHGSTPGLGIWADTYFKSLDGATEEGAEVVGLFDAH